MLTRIALLNIVKHRKRSLVVFAAAAVAVGIVISISGMFEGIRRSFFEGLVPDTGHIHHGCGPFCFDACLLTRSPPPEG